MQDWKGSSYKERRYRLLCRCTPLGVGGTLWDHFVCSAERANLKSHLDLHLIAAVCSERPKLLISCRFNCLTPKVLIWAHIVYSSVSWADTIHFWLFWLFESHLIFWTIWSQFHFLVAVRSFGEWKDWFPVLCQSLCISTSVHCVFCVQWMACQFTSRSCTLYIVPDLLQWHCLL